MPVISANFWTVTKGDNGALKAIDNETAPVSLLVSLLVNCCSNQSPLIQCYITSFDVKDDTK